MNIFEVFGFFILGSVFNVLVLIIFFKILIGNIRKSLESNINTLAIEVNKSMDKANGIFKTLKGGKNE